MKKVILSELCRLVKANKKIQAIKLLRQYNLASCLKQAKDIIEGVYYEHDVIHPTYLAYQCSVIHFTAKNDINGNPRRLYAIFHNHELIDIIDEGYAGVGALSQKWGQAGKILIIAFVCPISVAQYKQFKKQQKHLPKCVITI
jgi:hypothetical protein